jgi:hypothetical protein
VSRCLQYNIQMNISLLNTSFHSIELGFKYKFYILMYSNIEGMQYFFDKYILRQNYDIKIANRYFENVTQFRYLGTTITNQNLIQEEIKRRLNSGNVCYHSVQNPLSSRLLFTNIIIRIYTILILPVVLYVCETLSVSLREEQ